jgi:hypothetical protein
LCNLILTSTTKVCWTITTHPHTRDSSGPNGRTEIMRRMASRAIFPRNIPTRCAARKAHAWSTCMHACTSEHGLPARNAGASRRYKRMFSSFLSFLFFLLFYFFFLFFIFMLYFLCMFTFCFIIFYYSFHFYVSFIYVFFSLLLCSYSFFFILFLQLFFYFCFFLVSCDFFKKNYFSILPYLIILGLFFIFYILYEML